MLEWDIINVKVNCLPKILNISINSLVLLLMAAAFYDLKESLDPTVRTRLMLLRVLSMSILPTSMELPRSCFFRQPEPPWRKLDATKLSKLLSSSLWHFILLLMKCFKNGLVSGWMKIEVLAAMSSSRSDNFTPCVAFLSWSLMLKLKF